MRTARATLRRPATTAALTAAGLLFSAGCSSDGGGEPAAGSTRSSESARESPDGAKPSAADVPPDKGTVKVARTVAEGLKSPWGLAPLPGGDLLVSSRDDGTLTRVDGESGEKTEVGSVPGVAPEGEGGLLGIALSPDFASDRLVYAYFTTASDNRIARLLYDEKKPERRQLGAPDTVFKGIPKGFTHNGGRIAFGPDKQLYAGTGESGDPELSQDRRSLGGKILRMTPTGEPARDNPEPDSVVYSWGHRNVQGIAWDGGKRLWAAEFGQDTYDEVNLIKAGENYGWPEVEGEGDDADFVNPVAQWTTDEASPSGVAVTAGSVWMAGLRGERLWRVPLDGERRSADPQAFLEGEFGRLRTVHEAGEGKLWLVTSNTDGRGDARGGDDRILLLNVT
ncbi:PQQ-dependent sugar dehydrogenase [Streptomyces sp. NPDC060194]|uniref:PQQ-dependent sugar dehydrogenase n=1 Tax=Streptomyces sp. NPDC060194 TaxID=3347069 RepID=UPI003651873A